MHEFTFVLTRGELLSANDRLHWRRKAERVQALRLRASVAYARAGRPQMMRAHCTATVSYPDARRRDVENLAPTLKALVDGLVTPYPSGRGMLPDDDDKHLVGPDKRVGEPTRGGYTITLRFEEI